MVSPASYHLTPLQIGQYERDGYLIIRSFFETSTADALVARAHELLRTFDIENHPMTKFETQKDKHIGDDYFLESGDKVRYFFEPDSIDKEGKLLRPKEQSINKIGHALHSVDSLYRDFTLNNDRIKAVARDLKVFKDPRVIQSMVIAKQPKIGAPVLTHSDSTFLYSNPPSAVGMWFALERCTASNGCLSFLPGSHKRNTIPQRLVRVASGGTAMRDSGNGVGQTAVDWDQEEGWVVEECEVGDVVIIDGAVMHRSEANLSDISRFIYTFHLIEGEAEWDDKNWLQPTKEQEFSRLQI